jgi:hypothetical protein
MQSIQIVDTFRPVFVVHFSGIASDEEFGRYLGALTEQLETPGKKITILDARFAGRSPSGQRKQQAAWIKANETKLQQKSLGTVFVIDSPMVRAVLSAILWLQPMPTAHTICRTLEEAVAWSSAKLQAHDIPIPIGLMSYPVTSRSVA